jgi:phosphonate ABC transporter permease subunit PhnE
VNSTPSGASVALRRLLILLAIVLAVVIYSYGFSVTQIDLEKPQEANRQSQVQRALRELLSPRIFTQDVQTQEDVALANFRVGCATDGAALQQPEAAAGAPYLRLSPDCGDSGKPLTVEGFNFPANSFVNLVWVFPNDTPRKTLSPLGVAPSSTDTTVAVDMTGYFQTQVQIPRPGAGGTNKIHQISVEEFTFTQPRLSDTTNDVLAKMVETVFLALVATTLSIPFSVLVSFLAAHNLMRPVKTMLGTLLLGFILLPVGWWFGSTFLAPLGTLAVNLGQGRFAGVAAALSLGGMFLSVVTRGSLNTLGVGDQPSQWRTIVNRLLLLLGTIIVLGLIAGIMLLIGRLFTGGLPGMISNFFGIIGRLIELLMGPIAGLAAGFTLASIGTKLASAPLHRVAGMTGYLLGGLLGALSGGILFYGLAALGGQAALLGVLTPIIAGTMGAQILPGLYLRLTGTAASSPSNIYNLRLRSTVNTLAVVGGALGFVVTFILLEVQIAIVRGGLPNIEGFSPYLRLAALIGAVLGGLSGALSGAQANFPVGSVVYNITRTILNILRSIEPLIMGLVFVSWVGIGPFAGLLALTLHSIASLGKLYSEQIENIDPGPIEAIQATGANRIQTIVYAVVPQIVPPYIAFTMYRWDINVRMSTIIGFVGGGGIGFLLQQQINLLRYRDAGVAVLAIAVVVSLLDYASAVVRERLV